MIRWASIQAKLQRSVQLQFFWTNLNSRYAPITVLIETSTSLSRPIPSKHVWRTRRGRSLVLNSALGESDKAVNCLQCQPYRPFTGQSQRTLATMKEIAHRLSATKSPRTACIGFCAIFAGITALQ